MLVLWLFCCFYHFRSVGNKHTHLQARIERARQQYEGVSANLSDIKAEVDKYLLWLTKQEQMMSEKVIAGKHLQSAEIRLENSKVFEYVKIKEGIYPATSFYYPF